MSQITQIKNYNLWYLWFQFSIFSFQFIFRARKMLP